MPITTAVTIFYLLVLTACMPSDRLDQYRITVQQGTESTQINVDRTPTGFDFSDGSGVLVARALAQGPLAYQVSLPEGGGEDIALTKYVPTLDAPMPSNRTSAQYKTSDGGWLKLTRKDKVIVVELTSVPEYVLTIEPRGE